MAPNLATYPVVPDRDLILVLGRRDGGVEVRRGVPRSAVLGGGAVLVLRLSDVDDIDPDRPGL
jgi:hypothetical protein